MPVPLLDLRKQYVTLRDEIGAAMREVMESQRFILGPVVERFESNVAAYLGAKHAIGVASGSDALLLALMALDIGPGDEVVTTPFSFFATAGCIARLGARPIFVDIEGRGFNMCTNRLAHLLEGRTGRGTRSSKSRRKIRAIMPVHLYGQACDMSALMKLAREHGIAVIEDAAQAIGGTFGGRRVGLFGAVGCFSFFPSKNLGGWGDGGLITTQHAALAKKLKMLRVHGSERRYFHRYVGINSRLDALQAAVLNVKLNHLDSWTSARQDKADRYDRLLAEAGLGEFVTPPPRLPQRSHIFHQYVVRCARRDDLKDYLKRQSVETEVYYPLPLHLQKCFQSLGHKKETFPVAERASREVLALPIFPELTEEQQREVVSCMRAFYRS